MCEAAWLGLEGRADEDRQLVMVVMVVWVGVGCGGWGLVSQVVHPFFQNFNRKYKPT